MLKRALRLNPNASDSARSPVRDVSDAIARICGASDRVRLRIGGIEQMRGENLGDFGDVLAPGFLQMPGRREMPALAIPPRQRPVCRVAQQTLQEKELAALRGQPVVVETDDLFGDQGPAGFRRISSSGWPVSAATPAAVNDIPNTAASCTTDRSTVVAGGTACGGDRVQRLGHLQALRCPR